MNSSKLSMAELNVQYPNSTTVDEYAAKHGVSRATARRRLEQLVAEGLAYVSHNVIVRYASRRRGARSELCAVRGNQYFTK